MTARATASRRRATALFLGHLVNDGFGEFLTPLLPLVIRRFGLSLALAGALGTLRIVVNSLTQPFLGLLVDRMERPLLAVIGPALTVSAMCLVGLAPSYAALAAIMVVAALGTALFHPAAATFVGRETGSNRGLRMAFFSSGGTVGASLAPVAIVPFVTVFGLRHTVWLALPGLASVVLIAAVLLRSSQGGVRVGEAPHDSGIAPRTRIPARFVVLWGAIVLRSVTGTVFSYFMAVLITTLGGSTLAAAAGLTTFWIAGAAGEYAAGHLSDRHGRKPILFWTVLLASPCLLAFLHGPRHVDFLFLALAGFLIYGSNPVGIVAAQESLPGRTGLVTGLVMGLAWGIGGLALAPLGRLADLYGLLPVMTGISFLPILSAALVLFYREGGGAARDNSR